MTPSHAYYHYTTARFNADNYSLAVMPYLRDACDSICGPF
jgi:hypothetical protein